MNPSSASFLQHMFDCSIFQWFRLQLLFKIICKVLQASFEMFMLFSPFVFLIALENLLTVFLYRLIISENVDFGKFRSATILWMLLLSWYFLKGKYRTFVLLHHVPFSFISFWLITNSNCQSTKFYILFSKSTVWYCLFRRILFSDSEIVTCLDDY